MIINAAATSTGNSSLGVREHEHQYDTTSCSSACKLSSRCTSPYETPTPVYFERQCFLSASSHSSGGAAQETADLRPWAVRKPKAKFADVMRASCRLQGVVGMDYLYGRVSARQRKRKPSGSIDGSPRRWLDSPFQDKAMLVQDHVSLDHVNGTAGSRQSCRSGSIDDDKIQGDPMSDVEFEDESSSRHQQLTTWPGKNHDTPVTVSQESCGDFDPGSMVLDTYLRPDDLSSDFSSLAITSPSVLFNSPENQESHISSSALAVSRCRAPGMQKGDRYEYLYDEQGSFRLFIRGKEGGLWGDDGFIVDERAYA